MSRLDELVAWLPDRRSGALITSAVSREYILGFSEGEGVLVLSKEQNVYYAEAEIYEKAKQRIHGARVLPISDFRLQILNLMLSMNVSKVYIEPERMTVREYAVYREALHFAELMISNELSDKLNQMRAVKSAEELECVERAQSIADAAFKRFLSDARRGMTEQQAAGLLGNHIIGCGAELAFPVSASSGVNASERSAPNTARKLAVGDFLVLRFGAKYKGYCSDTTRTIAIGEVSAQMEEVYNAAVAANYDSLKALGAGRGCKLAESVARSTLNSWGGLDVYLPEVIGNGVGMEPKEYPIIGRESRSVLHENMVIAVETSVRIPNEFGVCLKDMAVITENGSKILSNTTKKLVHI